MKKKKLLRTFASLALVGALFASPFASATASAYYVEDDGAEIYAKEEIDSKNLAQMDAAIKDGGTKKTVIIQTNDVHGAVDKYAYVKALKDHVEGIENVSDVILVDCGDFSYAKEDSERDQYKDVNNYKGFAPMVMMNAVGYDYATVGNHEFEFNEKTYKDGEHKGEPVDEKYRMESLLGCANFDITSANLFKGDSLKYKPYIVYDNSNIASEEDKLKIGFFGLTAYETMNQGKKLDGYTVKSKEDMYKCAAEQCTKLKNDEHTDLIICLSHLGVKLKSNRNQYLKGNRCIDLYNNITSVDTKKYNFDSNPIDFILDGHSHNSFTTADDGVPAMQAGIFLPYVGITIINNHDKSIENHFLVPSDSIEPDQQVAALGKAILQNEYTLDELVEYANLQHELKKPFVDIEKKSDDEDTDADDKEEETTETEDTEVLDETPATGDETVTEEPEVTDDTEAVTEESEVTDNSESDKDNDSDKDHKHHSRHGSHHNNSRYNNNRWGSSRHHH